MRLPLMLAFVGCACASTMMSDDLEVPDAASPYGASVEIAPFEVQGNDGDPASAVAPSPAPIASCPVEIGPGPRPLPELDPPPITQACRAVPRAIRAKLAKTAREQWFFSHERSRLHVEHGCDRTTTEIGELIFETSSGHGFSLRLDRIRPRPDGDYDLLRLEYGPYGTPFDRDAATDWDWAARDGGRALSSVLPKKRVESMLVEMRAALHLRLEERTPSPPPNGALFARFTMSSRNFHVAYRLVDAQGHGSQGFWAGYGGSDEQDQWLPLDLAAAAYGKLLWSTDIQQSLVPHTPTAEDRNFFVERFATARERNEDYGYWYLRERLLAMARELGDARLMGDLLDLAGASGEHSVSRSQAAAVDVLVKLTGYDPRYDDDGTPRPPSVAAVDMRRLCN